MKPEINHQAAAFRLLVPFAIALLALFGASHSARAQTATPTPTPPWVQNGTNISNTNTGNVGIGTASPGALLDVRGNIALNGAVPAPHAATNYSALWLKNNVALMSEVASGYSIIKLGANYQRSGGTWSYVNASLPTWSLDMGAGPGWDQFSLSRSSAGTFSPSTLFMVNSSGNVGIGTASPASALHLAGSGGVSAITLNTPGTQRFRIQTLPGTPNWGGMTLNSDFNGTGWVLDDPNTNGWFFKLDGRGGNTGGQKNGLWLYRIPPGANSHSDESPVFGVTNGQAFFAGNVGIGVDTPAQKLDVAGRVNASDGLCIAGVCKSDWTQVGGASQWSATTGTTGIYYGTGNIGVGTASPSTKFSVTTANANDGIMLNGSTNWAMLGTNFNNGSYNNITKAGDRGIVYGGASVGNTGGGFVIAPWANAASGIRLDPSGNVGIGTASPANNLHLNVPASGAPIGAMSIDVGSFSTNSNAVNSYYFRVRDLGAAGATPFYIRGDGNVGIGTTAPTEKLQVAGNINATGAITGATINATYQDVAEWVPSTQKLQAGTVVVLDADRNNHVLASTKSYDTRVAGVVSSQPGLILGQEGDDKLKVATTGRVKVRVNATRAPIHVGDLLVTSDVDGVAMKSIPLDLGGALLHRPGTIIGKALEPLEKGEGEILVLLSLQ